MALELKHVAVDELTDLETTKLVEIASDANAILAGVKAELLRQEQERRQALVAAGLVEATPSQASGAAGNKRGPKTKAEKAAAEKAAAEEKANGHIDVEELDDALVADA